MPKMKTHSSCKKRFKMTASGKIKRAKAYRRHHAWAKDAKSVRSLRGVTYVHESNEARIKLLMPYA
ncbi:50S ribosomal protein L35 [Candidatus Dependentiae bacterium]|nr:50S ribosomal protein L35 [Candidatus Dependentiae bacterium]